MKNVWKYEKKVGDGWRNQKRKKKRDLSAVGAFLVRAIGYAIGHERYEYKWKAFSFSFSGAKKRQRQRRHAQQRQQRRIPQMVAASSSYRNISKCTWCPFIIPLGSMGPRSNAFFPFFVPFSPGLSDSSDIFVLWPSLFVFSVGKLFHWQHRHSSLHLRTTSYLFAYFGPFKLICDRPTQKRNCRSGLDLSNGVTWMWFLK